MLQIKVFDSRDYDDFYSLELLFNDYVDELGMKKCDIRRISNDYIFYLLIEDNKAIGFLGYTVRDMYGMLDKHISFDYIYIKEKYRCSIVGYYFYIQVGKIVEEMNMDCLIFPIVGSMSEKFKKMGIKMYDCYFIKKDVIISRKNKILERIKL